ncbi:MAG TPA: GNAT family N-acetyltransferase, partial [Micromonosporaceae bacterium]
MQPSKPPPPSTHPRMQIRWLDPAGVDRRDVCGAVATLEAARIADGRRGVVPTVSGFVGAMRTGWDGDAPLVAVAAEDHRVHGVLELTLPPWDNPDLGIAEITVDPLRRRRGVGRTLWAIAVERMRSAGRSTLVAEAVRGSTGETFLANMGFEIERGEQHRVQDVTSLDWAVLDRMYADARTHADGYELREIPPEAPDGMLDALTTVMSAINDAPLDARHPEPDAYPPERIRAYEAGEASIGRAGYRIVAVDARTGRFVGYTGVGVDVERPWYATQYATTVLADHRGHRLGLLLKIEMLRLLRDREPALREISTWNSPHNEYVVAVNDALGYR